MLVRCSSLQLSRSVSRIIATSIFKQCLPGSESDCGWHILTHQFGPGAPDGAMACNGVAFARELSGPWTWVNTSAYDKRVPTTGGKPIVLTNRSFVEQLIVLAKEHGLFA